MKRCPTCTRVLPDNAMLLCPYDGTPLLDTLVDSGAFADTISDESGDSAADPDPALERAAELARKIEYRQKLSALLNSEEGVRLAAVEIQSMFRYVRDKVELINEKYPTLQVKFGLNTRREATISTSTHVIIMSWQVGYSNTLSDSSFQLVERKRSGPYLQEKDEINRLAFDFLMDDEFKLCWKERHNKRCLTSDKLGQECISRLLHLASTDKL